MNIYLTEIICPPNTSFISNLPFAPSWDQQQDIRERKDIPKMYSHIAIQRND